MGKETNKVLVTILGVLMIFCGIGAIGSPFMMGAMMTTIIGIMLIIGGGAEIVMAFSSGLKTGFPVFLAGLLTVIAGGIVMANPILASAVFTILMSIFFISEGVVRSISSFKVRPAQGWGFALFSGVISILLGIMLMRGWPISGMMAIGVFAGIRLLFGGMNILTVSTVASAE